MFLLQYVLHHIRRSFIKSLCMMCISLTFTLLLCGLSSSIWELEEELKSVYHTMPIYVEVSDIKGNNRDDLFLTDSYIDTFTSKEYDLSTYLKEVCLKRSLEIQQFDGNHMLAADKELNLNLVGINRMEAEDSLRQGHGVQIVYKEGFTKETILESSQYCLVNETLLQLLGKELGDSILLTVKSPKNSFSQEEPREVEGELVIAGVIQGGNPNEIYCSWDKVSTLGGESDGSGIWYTQSLRATIRDNYMLSEFKEKAKRYYTFVDIISPKTEYSYALTVYDNIFMRTVFQIQRNLRFLKNILPVLLVFSFGIGFFTSYLFTRNRKKELAIMRSLGVGKRQVIMIIMMELCIISMAGILLGLLISYVLLKISIFAVLLFYAINALGGILCVSKIASGNVMKILKDKE